jgi:hypothetical protein
MIITQPHTLRQYESFSDLETITCKIQAFRDIFTISFAYSLFVFQVRQVKKYAFDYTPNLDPQIIALYFKSGLIDKISHGFVS